MGPGRGTLRGAGTSGRGVWATSDGTVQRLRLTRTAPRGRRQEEEDMGLGSRVRGERSGINGRPFWQAVLAPSVLASAIQGPDTGVREYLE